MPPAKSKKLLALERVVAVLQAITAGDDYWYTPAGVRMRAIAFEKEVGDPWYAVFVESAPRMQLDGPSNLWTEDMIVTVSGFVRDNVDTVSKMLKCIQDIRRAIETDATSGLPGSLSQIAEETIPDEGYETDDGLFSAQGFGLFDQKVRIRVAGYIQEL